MFDDVITDFKTLKKILAPESINDFELKFDWDSFKPIIPTRNSTSYTIGTDWTDTKTSGKIVWDKDRYTFNPEEYKAEDNWPYGTYTRTDGTIIYKSTRKR